MNPANHFAILQPHVRGRVQHLEAYARVGVMPPRMVRRACALLAFLTLFWWTVPAAAPLDAGPGRSGDRHRIVSTPADGLTSLISDALTGDFASGKAVSSGFIAPLSVDSIMRGIAALLRRDPSLAAHLPPTERLVAIRPTGTILESLDGSNATVVLSRTFDEPLRAPGANIVLVHNHPSSRGLSGADLGQLSKAGVAGIIAVGHDGSLYAASATSSDMADRLETQFYPFAKHEVVRHLRMKARALVEPGALDIHAEHLIALSLENANMIRYWFVLKDSRHQAYARYGVTFSQITVSVGARLKRQFVQSVASPIRSRHEES
jgi:hypothetical protein